LIAAAPPLPHDGLHFLARDAVARAAHSHGNLARPADPRGQPDPHALTAAQKLVDARTLEEALAWLTAVERVQVAGDPRLLDRSRRCPMRRGRHTLI
jgi:membrane glycosyltransferase